MGVKRLPELTSCLERINCLVPVNQEAKHQAENSIRSHIIMLAILMHTHFRTVFVFTFSINCLFKKCSAQLSICQGGILKSLFF